MFNICSGPTQISPVMAFSITLACNLDIQWMLSQDLQLLNTVFKNLCK